MDPLLALFLTLWIVTSTTTLAILIHNTRKQPKNVGYIPINPDIAANLQNLYNAPEDTYPDTFGKPTHETKAENLNIAKAFGFPRNIHD